ncbi:hypothetical protein M0813_09381 [Anaeramoeba flamelloides]|uniref:Endonuclease/exonuclease/phosphatase domain-containing protein n=1 Tax=Anaeramoeba flamelloides TaxID=1746091 RepID=A0ABQ8X5L9_9EUKA|nr:hypothetical protein M0813_09381 [Anaeramoeba flamelloides]
MHNISYQANYEKISLLLKKYIQFSKLTLFYDKYDRFKGTAKVILNTEENYTKLMDCSGKLYLYHRTLFFKKFVDYRRDAHKNKSVPTKQTQSISQNLNKNRNNNWFEENFLVNQENTPPNISNKFNNNVNNNNNQSQNNIGYLDKENENKKISNNQIIILNLPKKTKKKYENKITNLEREVQQLKLIIEQNENTLNLKFNKLNLKFLEESYGKNNNKGGLLIIIKNIFKEFTREILIPDLDMMGIQFTDYVIINIYKRHDRNVEINKKIFNVLQKYQNHKTIIGGDFNLKDNDIKIFSILNFKITLNNKPSRKDNNLDYFISNFNNLQFKRKVLNIRKEDYKLYSLIYKLFENNELIQEIKDRNRKKYLKLLDQINTEFENNENFWKKLNKFRQTSSKMILNNKNLEKTYFGFVNSITVLHSQLLYGLEIFDLTENDFKEIDTWINKKVTKFLLKINPHSPRLIYKTEAKIDSVRITIYKRKYKLIQKLNFLGFEKLIKLLPFREKESENINWKSKTLKDLELELDNYRINQLKNSPSWKVRKYLKIVTIQGNINKQQKYLKWKDIIEDLDHFLWNCPAYENNRKIWISELKNINISHILKNNNISNIIDRKDSITLLALVENKSIWKSLKKLLNHNLGIRANKRN